MLTKENNELLNEIYHAVKMGQHAINAVLPKVENPKLREKIESQGDSYGRIAAKSRRMLFEHDLEPQKETLMEKMGIWSSVQANTVIDKSSKHIADMMIQGSAMGIEDIGKKLSDLQDADAGAKELAEEYIQCEKKHMESMKNYL